MPVTFSPREVGSYSQFWELKTQSEGTLHTSTETTKLELMGKVSFNWVHLFPALGKEIYIAVETPVLFQWTEHGHLLALYPQLSYLTNFDNQTLPLKKKRLKDPCFI